MAQDPEVLVLAFMDTVSRNLLKPITEGTISRTLVVRSFIHMTIYPSASAVGTPDGLTA